MPTRQYARPNLAEQESANFGPADIQSPSLYCCQMSTIYAGKGVNAVETLRKSVEQLKKDLLIWVPILALTIPLIYLELGSRAPEAGAETRR